MLESGSQQSGVLGSGLAMKLNRVFGTHMLTSAMPKPSMSSLG